MNESGKSITDDPAEYLFKQAEFHDCHLTVGDPSTSKVEKIAVVKIHLVAHSSVFREMLMFSDLADPTGSNTHIKDVRPEIFKLMLRHMYGGNLQELQTINNETNFELAVCADKYNIQCLVEKACKRMIPRNLDEVFIALRFVAYVPHPVLVPRVTEFVQKQTNKIVQHKEFLNLDENCMEFITRQDKLAIDEVALWCALKKWGEYQTQHRNATFGEIIRKPLANVRFAAFSVDQVIKEVVPKEILSSAETVQLLSSMANLHVHNIPGLCKIQKKRGNTTNWYSLMECDINKFSKQRQFSWNPINVYNNVNEIKKNCEILLDKSTLCVRNSVNNPVAIESLEFKAKDLNTILLPTYNYKCVVTIVKHVNGYYKGRFTVNCTGNIVCEESVAMPLKSSTGKYCILEPGVDYKVIVKFSTDHPVYNAVCKRTGRTVSDYGSQDTGSQIFVQISGQHFHILKINYIGLEP